MGYAATVAALSCSLHLVIAFHFEELGGWRGVVDS